MDLLLLFFVIVLIALALASLFVDRRSVFKYDYVQPESFMQMYNGDVDPCDYDKTTIECGNYIDRLSFVIEE